MTPPRRALAVLALLAVCGLPAAVPAAAQAPARDPEVSDPRDQRGAVTLRVAAFTGAVSPDGAFRLRVRVANGTRDAEDNLRVVATFHRRAFHRLDFARAVDEGRVGDVYTSVSQELTPLQGRRVRTVEMRRTAEELGFRGEDSLGVYPLVIRLQRADETVQTIRTAVVVISSEVAQPLRAALVAPLDAPPALLPDGLLRPGGLRQDLAPRGRLRAMLSDLGGRPDLPMTFAVDARLLDDAADFADGYRARTDTGISDIPPESSLARAAQEFLEETSAVLAQPHVETVALSYGPADLSALVRGGMRSEAARLVSEGQARVEAHTGARPAPGVLMPADGISQAALSEAVNAGADAVVLPSDSVESTQEPSSASPVPTRNLRTAAGTTVTAAVPDPWLSELLADADALENLDPPVAVQRLIAETAAVYFERPFAEQARGLLLAPPLHWAPPDGFAAGLAGSLKAAPWLQAVTLSQLLNEIDAPERGLTRISYPEQARERELPQAYVQQLRASRRALGSLAGVLAEDAVTPGLYDRMLLTAASVWYRDDPADGMDLMRAVLGTVDELYASVRVPDSPTVLLSGIDGQIPVTVENTSTIPLRLAIRLETQRFAFDNGPTRIVLVEPESTQTVAFHARDRSPGRTSPIRVVVADADGQLELAEGTLVVRSTAVSAAALAVVIGAGVFLLVWWLRSFRKRRAAARAQETGIEDAA